MSGKARQHPWPGLLLVFVWQSAFADIYTGTNAHGIRWFSDTPPVTGEPYQQIQQSAPHPKPAPATPDDHHRIPAADTRSQRQTQPNTDVIGIQPEKTRRTQSVIVTPSTADHPASAMEVPASTATPKAAQRKAAQRKAAQRKSAKRAISPARAQKTKPSPIARVAAVKSARRLSANKTRQQRAREKQARETARREKRCQRYEQDLRKIHAQLRAGYTAAQGRKLRMRRNDLKERQFTECPTR